MSVFGLAVGKLGTGLRLLAHDPGRLLSLFRWRFQRYIVFSAPTNRIASPDPVEGLTLRRMAPSELEELVQVDEDIRDGVERCQAFLEEAPYGAFWRGRFAHLSWLVCAEHDSQRLPPRLVKLRAGEAEITFCVTLPEFRGRSIYPFMIRSLFQLARERGIHEVFMIIKADNIASQKGILKAGLAVCRGGIFHFRFLRMNLVLRAFARAPSEGRV